MIHQPDYALANLFIYEAAIRRGLDPAVVHGRSRKPLACQARWEVMKRLRKLGYSLKAIADAIDRDHTTVIHGFRAEAPGLWFG